MVLLTGFGFMKEGAGEGELRIFRFVLVHEVPGNGGFFLNIF